MTEADRRIDRMMNLPDAMDNALGLDEYADPFGAEYAQPNPGEASVIKPKEIKYTYGQYSNLPPLPGEERARRFTRASSLAKVLDDEFKLTQWKKRQVLRGVAMDPDMIAYLTEAIHEGEIDFDHQQTKNDLDRLADQAMDRAGSGEGAKAGTAFHDLAEAWDLESRLPQGGQPTDLIMLSSYDDILRRAGIKVIPELIERVIVCPELGVAGRLDRVYDDNGVISIGDLKSQKWEPGAFDSLSLSIQLAVYANATYMLDMETWEWIPMPPISKDNGIIVWVPATKPGKADIYDIDLREGWKFAKAASKIKEWRKRKDIVTRRRVPGKSLADLSDMA